MDLTIVIPHRGNSLGLWLSISSFENDLVQTKLETNYVIVSNGEPIDAEAQVMLRYLDKTGRLLQHIHCEEPLTPPTARTRGAAVADGDLLFFADNHVSLASRFFERAMHDVERYNADILHSTTRFWAGDVDRFHYSLRLGFNFWGSLATLPTHEFLPYRVASAGHGAFFIKRSVWDAVDGYGPEGIYQGYAGEEFNLNLKAWRMGFESWLDPKLLHYHWAGNRVYARHYTDDYYTNLMVSAFVIGGQSWLDRVYESFTGGKHLRVNPKRHMFDLLQTAYQRGADYSKELDSKCVHSLDATLKLFSQNVIAH